jgi:putative ABC transport system substrate-binding protein
LLTLALAAAPLAAEAQQVRPAWRIGYLSAGSPPAQPSHLNVAFRQSLRELGYTEGQHITIEYRWGEGKSHRLPDLAAELVNLKVSVMFASSVQAALAAKQATKTIPIVFVMLGDPVAAGLVASLAQPGGNVTGLGAVAGGGGEIAAKRLQLLKEIAPAVTRIAVLWNPHNPGNVRAMKVITDAAGPLGVHLYPHAVAEPATLGNALAAMAKEPVGALLVVADPTFGGNHKQIVDFASKNRLPSIYAERQAVDAGGLMSYQANLADMHRRAAGYVDKILKGAKPGHLPVELPTRFELVINVKSAKALGLTVPPLLLLRADHVIE